MRRASSTRFWSYLKNNGLPKGSTVYSSIFDRFSLHGVVGGCGAYPSRRPETGGEIYEDKQAYRLSVTPKVSLESPDQQSGLGELARESPSRPGPRPITKVRTYHSVIFAGCFSCLSVSNVHTFPPSLSEFVNTQPQIQPKQSAVSAWHQRWRHQRAELHGWWALCLCVCVCTFLGPSLGELIPVWEGWKISPRKHHQHILRWRLKVTGNILG